MPLMSAALTARLSGADPGDFFAVEVTLPSLGVVKWADQDVASDSGGEYLGKVMSVGSWQQQRPDWRGTLQGLRCSVDLEDVDGQWAKIVEGAHGRETRYAPIQILLGARGVERHDWWPYFTGEITTPDGWPSPGQVRLQCAVSDRPFRHQQPKPGWLLTSSDWPDADPDVIGQLAPLIWGVHDSKSTTHKGMVPLLCIDTVNHRYLAAGGWLKDIRTVYEAGDALTGADWSVSHPVVSGRTYTLVTLAAPPPDPGTEYSADVEGYDTNGDGTGDLIEDPPAVIVHQISNFIVGDWQTGPWLSTAAIVDAASFACTYWSTRGAKASARVKDRMLGGDLVKAVAASHGVLLLWSQENKITCGVADPTRANLYALPHLRGEDLTDPPSISGSEQTATSVARRFLLDSVREDYAESLFVREPYVEDDEPDEDEAPCSSSQ